MVWNTDVKSETRFGKTRGGLLIILNRRTKGQEHRENYLPNRIKCSAERYEKKSSPLPPIHCAKEHWFCFWVLKPRLPVHHPSLPPLLTTPHSHPSFSPSDSVSIKATKAERKSSTRLVKEFALHNTNIILIFLEDNMNRKPTLTNEG